MNRPNVIGGRTIGRVAIGGLSTALVLVGSGVVLSPASADAPVKVGWWNLAAAGQPAPGPDAPAGGMRVAVASQEVASFGAVQYALPADATATLELPVAQMTGQSGTQPTNIEACPTANNSWKAGDDQDISTAPAYDCDSRHFIGHLSSDSKTMTFLVDGSADVSPGILSLALVPVQTTGLPVLGTDTGTGADVTPPFVIDFAKPGASSFTSSGGSSSAGGTGSSAPPPPPPPAAGGTGSAGSTGSGTSSAPAPSLPTDSGVTTTATTPDSGQTPVVAGSGTSSGQPAATGAYTPQAAARPATDTNNRRNILILLLVALGFAILYTQNQQRAPRALAGPRAGDGDGGAATAALPAAYPAYAAPRGLGRFAKPRERAARPLI